MVNTACAYVLLSHADMANVKVQTMERDSDVFVLNSTLVSGIFFHFLFFIFFSFKIIPYWTHFFAICGYHFNLYKVVINEINK